LAFQFAILAWVTLVGVFFHFMAMARPVGLRLHIRKYSLELVSTPPHNHVNCFSPKFLFKLWIYLFSVIMVLFHGLLLIMTKSQMRWKSPLYTSILLTVHLFYFPTELFSYLLFTMANKTIRVLK
jgi:hypothetical protein